MEACHKANYQYYGNWRELRPEERAVLVAHYYAGILIENHKQDALNQEMERASKKANKGKKK